MENITLSLIIPYHDEDPALLYPLLTSIKNQKDFDFNTLEILLCRGDINKFPELNIFENLNIRFIYEESINGSPGTNRQLGIKYATGKYLAFCDADDEIATDTIFSRIEYLSQFNYDIIDFPFMTREGDNEFYTANSSPFQLWASIYKLDFIKFNHVEFPSTYYGEDLLFVIEAASCNPNRYWEDSLFYRYILRAGSAITSRSSRYEAFVCDTASVITLADDWDTTFRKDGIYLQLCLEIIIPIIASNLIDEVFGQLSYKSRLKIYNLLYNVMKRFKVHLYLISSNNIYLKNSINIIDNFLQRGF